MDDLSTANYSTDKGSNDYYSNVIEGKWVLDVTFSEEKDAALDTRTFPSGYENSEAGYTIAEVSLSPLSVILKYTIDEEGGYLEVSKIIYDNKTIEIDHPYFQAASAPGMECITINALDNIIDIESVCAIEVTYNNFLYGKSVVGHIDLK